MDTKQLERELRAFLAKCKEKGRPIDKICLTPAFPGITDTSYNLQVRAPWTNSNGSCWESIDFLFDLLFETTSVEVRENIFMIQIMGFDEEVSCQSEPIEDIHHPANK